MKTKYKIEKGITIPKANKGLKYPFQHMIIGDSFLFDEKYTRHTMTKISTAGRAWAKQSRNCKHYKFLVRKVDNNIRIWRIK